MLRRSASARLVEPPSSVVRFGREEEHLRCTGLPPRREEAVEQCASEALASMGLEDFDAVQVEHGPAVRTYEMEAPAPAHDFVVLQGNERNGRWRRYELVLATASAKLEACLPEEANLRWR